jgi:hypothetical protein
MIPYTAGVVFEHLLRCWLDSYLPLIPWRTIVSEAFDSELLDYMPETGGWYNKYDEIDAIIGDKETNTPYCLVEMRCSCHRLSQYRVTQDLERRLEIARLAWPDVTGLTITVRTGPWRYRRTPQKLVKGQMVLDAKKLMSMVKRGENQSIVVELPELQAWAFERGLALEPEFLNRVHEFGINNFMRKKEAIYEHLGTPQAVTLPSVYPWSFPQLAAV